MWENPNARPESVRDRLVRRYEMVFLDLWRVAALEHGCSFVGIDLDPACEAMARSRIADFGAAV
ncbi:hypothetical protein AB0K15_47515 [Amycolatopsis sp. NPDC049253]|uniref:hypothetical protein n=1 Tax=Amycolatopsis sp. NPDC049253 TaxID=3155274 RepID=UPI00342347C3